MLIMTMINHPNIVHLYDVIETEEKIRASIKEMSVGHTTFIISHRVSSFESCDVILVLKDGKLVQMGTHEELVVQDGYYRDVYNEQN